MAKFRCITCNEPIELNQHRGFKAKEHRCKCGGNIEAVYYCELYGCSPERIETATNNDYTCPITRFPYYSAWRNKKRSIVYIINKHGKFQELTFVEHNNFDYK